MPGLLDGRIALVTGAGSGIGEAIALAMAGAGARIVSVDINVGAAVRVAKAAGGEAVGLACDVTDRPSCDALATTVGRDIGRIGILVNNAGIIRRGQVTDANTRRDWDETLAVNLDGPYNMVTAFLEQPRETGNPEGPTRRLLWTPAFAGVTGKAPRLPDQALAISAPAAGRPTEWPALPRHRLPGA